MLKMSPTRYFWYFAKLPVALSSTNPSATDVEENTPIIVSAEAVPFTLTVIIAKPRIMLNITIATSGSLIPRSTPKAIPVSAE